MSIEIAIRHRFETGFDLDVSLRAKGRNRITALFGPSGVGKTSVLNTIAGLLRPDAGRIAVDGQLLFDSDKQIWTPPRERRVGYVFQDARLFPHLTVGQNLHFGWRRTGAALPREKVSEVAQMLGLLPLLERKPRNLSGGERASVAIGRALLSDPHILLLDEPLAGLDAARKNDIFPYLERLRDTAGIPIIYVSHSLEEISRVADDLVVMDRGAVVAQGALFDLLSDLRIPELNAHSPFGAVFATQVARHLPNEGLTILAFSGGELRVPLLGAAESTKFRTHVRATDVMIALEEPRRISANNILPATISDIRESTAAHVDVRLRCGEIALVARITHASRKRLGLALNAPVFAVVKSVSVAPQTGVSA